MINRPSDATMSCGTTMPVVEWFAPVRDREWVAACFGTLDV
jgi:hypothetical protein